MIHAEYIRDLHSNYMVIKGIEGFRISYRVKILLNNTIDGLLKTELRCIDTMDLFYYNITDKKTLNSVYENKTLKYDEIKHFLESILRIIDQSSEYLLSEDDFIVDPNYIYYDSKMQEFKLCYLVGHNNNLLNQLGNLIEFLMNKVDYKDEQAVVLIYALYKEVKESGCSYEKLNQILNGKQEETLNIKQNTIQDEMLKQSELEIDNNKSNKNIHKNSNNKNGNIKYSDDKNNNIKNVSVLNKINSTNNVIIKNSTRNQEKTHKKMNFKSSKNKPDNNIKTKLKNRISVILKKELKNEIKDQPKNELKNKQKNTLKYKFPPNKKKENHNSNSNNRLPFLEEIENDREVYYYHPAIFILSGLSILLTIFIMAIAIHFKVLHNSFGTKLDVIKTSCFMIVIGLVEFYIQVRLFDKKNRNTKIMTEIEYIEPNLEEYSNELKDVNIVYEDNKKELQIEKTALLWSQNEEDEKTRILFSFISDKKEEYELLNPIDNSTVTLDTYPFMIGKMASIVNMAINETSVSRYHAKITLDDEVLYITDLGSTNGTYINDTRIHENKQYPISNKDEIKFSNVKYILRKIVN